MRKSSFFWGLVIILVGCGLLLNNLFPGLNVQVFIWPGLLILLGIWFLLGPALRRGDLKSEAVSIPLENIQSAELRFQHGAGKMTLTAGSRPGTLLEGEFAGGLNYDLERDDQAARLRLRSKLFSDGVFIPGTVQDGGLIWNIGLTRDIPLQLRFDTGACESLIDLNELNVTAVSLHTGASRTEITLPARAGHTQVKVESGMAGVAITVPDGVAARIKVASGMASINVAGRFPAVGGGYCSLDYETAQHKADISIDTGLGSVDIR